MEMDEFTKEIGKIKSLEQVNLFVQILAKTKLKFDDRFLLFLEEQLSLHSQDEKLLVIMNLVLCSFKKCLENSYSPSDWENIIGKITSVVSKFFTRVLQYLETSYVKRHSFNQVVIQGVILFWSIAKYNEVAKKSLLNGISGPMLTIITSENIDIAVRKCTLITYISNFLSVTNNIQKSVIRSNINYVPVMLNWVVTCGDYEIQEKIIEFCLHLSSQFKNKLLQLSFWLKKYPEISDIICRLDIQNFLTTSREFLNFVNGQQCSKMQVISVPCISVHVEDTELWKPCDKLYSHFWVDFSIKTGNIHIIYGISSEHWSRISVTQDNVKSIKSLTMFHNLKGEQLDCKELIIVFHNAIPVQLMPKGIITTNLKILMQEDNNFHKVQQSFLKACYGELFLAGEVENGESEIMPVNTKMKRAPSSSKCCEEKRRYSFMDTTISSIRSSEPKMLRLQKGHNMESDSKKNGLIYTSTPMKRPIIAEPKMKLPGKLNCNENVSGFQNYQANLDDSKYSSSCKHPLRSTNERYLGLNFFKQNTSDIPAALSQSNCLWNKNPNLPSENKLNGVKGSSFLTKRYSFSSFKDHPLYKDMVSQNSFSSVRTGKKCLSLNNRVRTISSSAQSDSDSRGLSNNLYDKALSSKQHSVKADIITNISNSKIASYSNNNTNNRDYEKISETSSLPGNNIIIKPNNDDRKDTVSEATGNGDIPVPRFYNNEPRESLEISMNRKSSESQKDEEILHNSQTLKHDRTNKNVLNLFEHTMKFRSCNDLSLTSVRNSHNLQFSNENTKQFRMMERQSIENRMDGTDKVVDSKSEKSLMDVSVNNISDILVVDRQQKDKFMTHKNDFKTIGKGLNKSANGVDSKSLKLTMGNEINDCCGSVTVNGLHEEQSIVQKIDFKTNRNEMNEFEKGETSRSQKSLRSTSINDINDSFHGTVTDGLHEEPKKIPNYTTKTTKNELSITELGVHSKSQKSSKSNSINESTNNCDVTILQVKRNEQLVSVENANTNWEGLSLSKGPELKDSNPLPKCSSVLDKSDPFETLLHSSNLGPVQKPLRTYNRKNTMKEGKKQMVEVLDTLAASSVKQTPLTKLYKESTFGSSGRKRKLFNSSDYERTPFERIDENVIAPRSQIKKVRSIYSDIEDGKKMFFKERNKQERRKTMTNLLFRDIDSNSESETSTQKRTLSVVNKKKDPTKDKNVEVKKISHNLRSRKCKNYKESSSNESIRIGAETETIRRKGKEKEKEKLKKEKEKLKKEKEAGRMRKMEKQVRQMISQREDTLRGNHGSLREVTEAEDDMPLGLRLATIQADEVEGGELLMVSSPPAHPLPLRVSSPAFDVPQPSSYSTPLSGKGFMNSNLDRHEQKSVVENEKNAKEIDSKFTNTSVQFTAQRKSSYSEKEVKGVVQNIKNSLAINKRGVFDCINKLQVAYTSLEKWEGELEYVQNLVTSLED